MSADKIENGVQSLVYEVLLWVKIRTPPDKDYGQTTWNSEVLAHPTILSQFSDGAWRFWADSGNLGVLASMLDLIFC